MFAQRKFIAAAAIGLLFLVAGATAFSQENSVEKMKAAAESTPMETLLVIKPDNAAPRNSEGDIVELSDGRLALVYSKFSGGNNDHSNARLVLRTSGDGGKSWSADRELVENEGGRNVMSVSMLPSLDGGILLFYLRKDTAATSCALYVRRSMDDLATVSDPLRVTTLPGYHVVNNGRVIRLSSGRLLVPAALHTDLEDEVVTTSTFSPYGAMVVYFSDDDGTTWKRDNMPIPPKSERKIMLQEPGVVELSDGRLMMYIRTDRGFQYAAYSSDAGVTWTKPEPITLASPRSPATIKRIPGTDRLVAVWNDHSGLWPYTGENRTPLCIATSADNGKTWSQSRVLEGDPEGWYCYTSMTFTGGDLILSYCAGRGRAHGLNQLKVSKLPLEWVSNIQ